jgi:hypothetical protein
VADEAVARRARPLARQGPQGLEAVKAASRVFDTVNLVGLTREEVIARIGDPTTSSDSIYNFPFYPGPPGGMVYRFDTGSHGWQFNLDLDEKGKVSKVERLWIH